jgi:hypothetical protein
MILVVSLTLGSDESRSDCKSTGIKIQTLFMWFNYAVIFISGLLVGLLVYRLTQSKEAGILSMAVITFGSGGTMHLFWSGTAFNIIEFLVILPILLILLHFMINEKKLKWLVGIIPVGLLMFFFHPSLGTGIGYGFIIGGVVVFVYGLIR